MGMCPINEIQVQWNTPGFRHIYGWAPSAVLKNIGPRITLEDEMCIYSITRTHTLPVWGQERIGWSQDWKQWAEHYWLIYESHRAGNRTKFQVPNPWLLFGAKHCCSCSCAVIKCAPWRYIGPKSAHVRLATALILTKNMHVQNSMGSQSPL